MQGLLYDLVHAMRLLRKTPGVAFLAIATLALGIGANTAIFTVVQSVLLRPLPYANSDRLLYIAPATAPSTAPGYGATSWLNYRDIRAQSRLLQGVAGYSEDVGVLQTKESAQSILAPRLSPNLIPLLGVQPLMGRTFSEAEGQPNGPAVVLLSEALWRQNLHADPDIVGKPITISGKPYTVVGVMPGSFVFPEQMGPDMRKGLWLPLQPTGEMARDRGYNFFQVIAQPRPGVSLKQAQAELDSIDAHISPPQKEPVVLRALPYQEVVTGPVRPVLLALVAALALVLLIACANVSNLLIARCLARQQEFAVRAAIGAGRGRLIQQLLAEGLVLSLGGCALGVLIAKAAMGALTKLPSGTIPRADSITMHWTVILVLTAVAIVTTVLSSLLPAFLVARSQPQSTLLATSRGTGSRTVGGKISGGLVAGEVALSTLLLIGTGLLFHTLWNLQRSRLGFETAHITTFDAMPATSAGFSQMAVAEEGKEAPPSVATQTYQPLLDQIRRMPGVEGAALVTSRPLSGMDVGTSFEIVGSPTSHADRPEARITAVSSDYARVMGTPLLRGRMIEEQDVAASPMVAVINEALARKYFPGKDPLQKQIDLGGKDTGMIKPYTVVGVLADQIDSSVGGTVKPFILISQYQIPTTSLFYQALLETAVTFVVKTRGDLPIAEEIRSVFHQSAPGFGVDDFETMQHVVDGNTFSHRLGLYLVGSFAGLAVAMVIAGLYGVLSQLVSYRRREIGVRMALGATRKSVAQLILRQGSLLIGIGLGLGLLLSLVSARLMQSFLYEVHPVDLGTYLGVALALPVIGLIAAFLPARRAASIEPMEALRSE
jgi:putative ABC transport system permease protein